MIYPEIFSLKTGALSNEADNLIANMETHDNTQIYCQTDGEYRQESSSMNHSHGATVIRSTFPYQRVQAHGGVARWPDVRSLSDHIYGDGALDVGFSPSESLDWPTGDMLRASSFQDATSDDTDSVLIPFSGQLPPPTSSFVQGSSSMPYIGHEYSAPTPGLPGGDEVTTAVLLALSATLSRQQQFMTDHDEEQRSSEQTHDLELDEASIQEHLP